MNLLKNILLIISIIGFLVYSCKEESKILKKNKTYEVKDELKKKSKILSFKYFDTILNNDIGRGVLKYNMKAKIKQSAIINRYIVMYTLNGKEDIKLENSNDYEALDRKAQGAFLDTVGDGTFNFDYRFSKTGKQYLTIAFVELIDYKDSLNKKTLTSYSYSSASIPVMVIDSNSVLGTKDNKLYYEYERKTTVKRKDSLRLAIENKRKIDSMKRVLNK